MTNAKHTRLRLPETMTSAEVGAYLRGLREHFKLSALDVSERLHIRVRYVTAIEENNYDQLPGKIYARGYVHTYAEFLGLDANQVVTICFGAEEAPKAPVFKPRTPVHRNYLSTNWWGIALAAAAGIFILLLVSLFTGTPSAPNEPEETVAPVPDAILETVRDSLMPTAHNRDCLMGNTLLSCFFADAPMQHLMKLQVSESKPLSDAELVDPLAPVSESEVSENEENANEETASAENETKPESAKKITTNKKPETKKTPANDDKKTHRTDDDSF
jgi:hypothetical protein